MRRPSRRIDHRSWFAGLALDSAPGVTGPAALGAIIAALTLVPTTALAVARRRGSPSLAAPANA